MNRQFIEMEFHMPEKYVSIIIGPVNEMTLKAVPYNVDGILLIFNDGEVPIWLCTLSYFLLIVQMLLSSKKLVISI